MFASNLTASQNKAQEDRNKNVFSSKQGKFAMSDTPLKIRGHVKRQEYLTLIRRKQIIQN